jgi:outer membrane protein assembly factor BamE
MMPTVKPTGALRALPLLALVALAVPGCVYRPNIQQGNLLDTTDVDEVTVGMTRSQVRYLLGTPMVSDPFDAQRWDYVYTFRQGRSRSTDRAHIVVHFDGDKVSRLERLDLPDEIEAQRNVEKAKEAEKKENKKEPAGAAAEAPPAPETQPPPASSADPLPPGG